MTLNTLIMLPPDPPGAVFTREMRCQEKKEVLGTAKPPLTPALLCAIFENQKLPFELIENMPPDDAAAYLKNKNFVPDLIIFPTCTPTIARDMESAARLKTLTGAMTAAFGPHTSGIPRETLAEFPALDFAIIGEPEETCIELAQGETPFDSIRGIAFRNDAGNIVVNESRPGAKDLDALPVPAWERFNLSQYKVPLFGKKFLLIETARGCPYSCGFCVVPLTHGNSVREKSVPRIIEEMLLLRNKYGVDFFYLWADTAVLNKNSMSALCDAMVEKLPGIEWISNTRPETVSDAEFAKKLRAAGCRMLSMGAESGDAATLDKMNKKLRFDTLKKSIAALRAAKIRSFVFFIFGYPGETKDTMKSTLRLALELDPDYANFYPAVPYPGTPLWRYCTENGMLLSNEWASVDFSDYILAVPGLSQDDVMNMVRAARLKFYFRPSYILRSMRDLASPARALDIAKAIPAYLKI